MAVFSAMLDLGDGGKDKKEKTANISVMKWVMMQENINLTGNFGKLCPV